MNVLHVVGARPNLVKAAPVARALSARRGVLQSVVHTGQHYDANLSTALFEQLGLADPVVNLGVGSSSHTRQIARIMTRLEPVVVEHAPDLVMVYGDVNSTLAATLVCVKLLVSVAHVEAGLRCYDPEMPEETNRRLVDQLASILFTPSECADENLLREGIPASRIRRVGNVMIDSLVRSLPAARRRSADLRPTDVGRPYGLVTLHRPPNVDDPAVLSTILTTLEEIGELLPLVFPVHPRTRARLDALGRSPREARLSLLEPLSYVDFLALEASAKLVITDSGGVQEETTFLGVPCLTLRETTERPVTVTVGTNVVVGRDLRRLRTEVSNILAGKAKSGGAPPLWDGRAAERIADDIAGARGSA